MFFTLLKYYIDSNFSLRFYQVEFSEKMDKVQPKNNRGSIQAGQTGTVVANQESQGARANKKDIDHQVMSLAGRDVQASEAGSSKPIVVNIYELLKSISDINCSKPGHLKVVLETLDELNRFMRLLAEQPHAEFIKRVSELDFREIRMESTSETGPITITLPESLNHLRRLFIGGIGYKVMVNLPRTLNNLEELHIREIRNAISIPREMPCLKKLIIGATSTNAQFKLPSCLDNLEELYLGLIDVTYDLPERLDKLKILEIENIMTSFNIPLVLDNLTAFIIKGLGHPFAIPNSFDKLEILEIGETYGDAYFQLPKSIPTLVSLKIKEVYGNNQLTLPESLENLKSLEVKNGKDEHDGFKVILSKSYCNLENLTINKQKANLICTDGHKEFILECDSTSFTAKFLEEINQRINVKAVNITEEEIGGQGSDEDSNEESSSERIKKRTCSIQ